MKLRFASFSLNWFGLFAWAILAMGHGQALAAAGCPGPDLSHLVFHPNDKIVFMGDSITFRTYYTRQVMDYLDGRFPGYNLQYVNCGNSGWSAKDTALNPGGLTYVLSLNPSLVTICLGMNDGMYQGIYISGTTTAGAACFADYKTYMDQIVSTLQTAHIRVALITPGIVDLAQENLWEQNVAWRTGNTFHIDAGYNTVLQNYSAWLMTYAQAHSVPAYNLNTVMMATDTAAKAALTAAFTMLPEDENGVHPDMAGALVYAYALLKALGVPPRCQQISLDASALKVTGGPGLCFGPVQTETNGISFTLTTDPKPYVPLPGTYKVRPYIAFQQDFNDMVLTASGLSAASYYVVVDGYRKGAAVTQAALAAGINLLDYWTQPAQSVTDIHHIELQDASQFAGPAVYNDVYSCLIDDMETSNFQPAWVCGLYGGLWFSDKGGGAASTVTPSPFVMSAPGYNSAFSAWCNGNFDNTGYMPALTYWLRSRNQDLRDGIQFWFKASAGISVAFHVHSEFETNHGYYNDYQKILSGAAYCNGTWVIVQVPYTDLTLPGGTNYARDPSDMDWISWSDQTTGAYDIAVDNVAFYSLAPDNTPATTPITTPCVCPPTPSFSPTPTTTRTPVQGHGGSVSGEPVQKVVPDSCFNPSKLFVKLGPGMTSVQCRLYTGALTLAWQGTLPDGKPSQWNIMPLPAGWSDSLANGLYYMVVSAPQAAGTWSGGGSVKIYLAR